MAKVLMLYLGSLMLRSLCTAAIAGACTLWIRNVAVRHAIWVAVLMAMLLMPIADAVLPASWIPRRLERVAVEKVQTFHIVSSRSETQPTIALPAAPASATKRATDWWSVAVGLYVFVGLALVARLGLTLRRILRLKRASIPVTSNLRDEIAVALGLKRLRPLLRESADLHVPITLGFFRPVVLLPSDWTQWEEWKLRAVLSHEFAHVRRADWAIAAIAAINQCVFWFNPLAAFLRKHLSELAERSSDDAALQLTADSTRYAEVLLQFAAAHNGYRFHTGGIAMAKQNMKSRIERVLNIQSPGNGVLKLAGWALVLALAMPVLYAAAAIQVASNASPVEVVRAGQSIDELQNLEQIVHYLKEVKNSVRAEQAGLPASLAKLAELEKLRSAAELQNANLNSNAPQDLLNDPRATAEMMKQTKQQVEEAMRRLQENGTAQKVQALQDRLSDVAVAQTNTVLSATPGSSAPKVVSRVEPVYPADLRSAGVEGTVFLSVTIGRDGGVSDIATLAKTPPDTRYSMVLAAIEAVRQWTFQPTVVNGQATTITTEIPIEFKLNPAGNDTTNRTRSDALLNLPGNEDDLLAYLTQLAQLRGGGWTGKANAVNSWPAQSYKVYVTGKVLKGGVFQSEKPITVFQALSLAGGLAGDAKKEEIVIIRSMGQGAQRDPFNYTEVYEGKKLNQNIFLESGDVVVVP